MPEITALFWDIGGVLLTNGWDRLARAAAAERFELDPVEFGDRHELVVAAFETGGLGLDGYLEHTIFYRPRPFTREQFAEFMFGQSHPHPEALEVVERLAAGRRYLLAALNNESLELNRHRIERFGLRRYFSVFVSSCYVGVRKPDEAIYRLALDLTQRPPEECVLIDDRPLNLECAASCGMRTIHYQGPVALRHELRAFEVEV
ncbi:MAG TPA: HAD family phosphatase [Anaerolineales bacterium]|nr:HAD family phosphatase [Anaerolineales bacterium]